MVNDNNNLENNYINNTEFDINNHKIEILYKDDDYDINNSVNKDINEINTDEKEVINRNDNKVNENTEEDELFDFDNDLYELNNHNLPILDRLLLKEDVKKEIKDVIENIKNHKSKKRFKVSGDSDDEKIMKRVYEKETRAKVRYPKK